MIAAWRRITSAAGPALAVIVFALAACGSEAEPTRIDWDLSREHTMDQVDWPSDRLDAGSTQLKPVESARIKLSATQLLEMGDDAASVILYRSSQEGQPLPGDAGRVIENVEVYTEPLSVEDAYRRALSYAAQFGIARRAADDWLERRRRGVEQATDRTLIGERRPDSIGPDGPLVKVELLYSANDERPWVVMVGLYWPPDRHREA